MGLSEPVSGPRVASRKQTHHPSSASSSQNPDSPHISHRHISGPRPPARRWSSASSRSATSPTWCWTCTTSSPWPAPPSSPATTCSGWTRTRSCGSCSQRYRSLDASHEDTVWLFSKMPRVTILILCWLCVSQEHCHHLIVSFTNPITIIPTS